MTAPMTLHYAPDNASLCVRLALDSLDLPFRTILVDRKAKAQRSADYLAMNPMGRIPVLETPSGPMFETAAILMWLAHQRPGTICPAQGDPGRVHAVQWMFWLSNTLHTTLRHMFYPGYYAPGAEEVLHARAKARLAEQLGILEAATTTPWLEATTPTAHGVYLAPMLRWAQIYAGPPGWMSLSATPRLAAFAARAEEWPATARAIVAEGLGPMPFTAPSPANPPEGTAL